MKKNPELEHDPFLSSIFNQVNYSGQNMLICVVGRPGSGKSYLALRLAEMFDSRFRGIENPEYARYIIEERVVTKPEQFAGLISNVNGRIPYGSVVIIDEAGIAMPYESWQSMNNRLMSTILQSFRNRRLITIFTLPNLKFLSIQARRLLNIFIEMKSIDRSHGLSNAKVRIMQVNPYDSEVYRHRPKFWNKETGSLDVYDTFNFRKPSSILIEAYEEMIYQFKTEVAVKAMDDMTKLRKKGEKKQKKFIEFGEFLKKDVDPDELEAMSIQDIIIRYKDKDISSSTASLAKKYALSFDSSNTDRISPAELLEK